MPGASEDATLLEYGGELAGEEMGVPESSSSEYCGRGTITVGSEG